MPDTIGRITVPEVAPSGTFPLVPSWGFSQILESPVAVHVFGAANAKIEQRFLLGSGARRFQARFGLLNETQRQALRDFWESRKGAYQPFTLNWPNDDGIGTTAYIVRFENDPLSWEFLADSASSAAVTFVEVKVADFPTYTLNDTQERFPDAALQTALLDQIQQIVPLIYIRVREAAVDDIFLSDRRCTVGAQLYQARLLSWDGISQELGGASDQARFTFGNADRVMRDLANDTDLDRATIRFSLFHVGTGVKLDLWQGQVIGWGLDAGPEFTLAASDGLYELNLPYPTRKVSRRCWKVFKGPQCPYVGAHATCDKGFTTPNGCQFHAMDNYFGGIQAQPYGGLPSDRNQAIMRALRVPITSTSQVADTIFNEVVPEIYTNVAMKVTAKIAAGREENEFYDALGVVGEGPITAYGAFLTHSLDNQPPHGPDPSGLRLSLGGDYLTGENPDPFSLGSGDPQVYGPERAAGTAFLELRRKDAKGLNLTRLSEHEMKVTVTQGLGGWTWSAPGARAWTAPLTNPVWIAVNMLLRAVGLRAATAANQELVFDATAAIAAAAVCNQVVDKIVGTGTETQFTFNGILQEAKPLRDWLAEVLMGCQGYYTWACGKMRLGVRYHSGTAPPGGGGEFSIGNMLFNSLRLEPVKPAFNHLTAHFADSDYEFGANALPFYDVDHATQIAGAGAGPIYLYSEMNLVGVCGKSQAARLVTTRLREELGGITPAEWRAARQVAFQTTILALAVEPGMPCLLTHADMPGGAGEFRVTGWRLNADYSVEITGRSTTDSMYDLTAGPKPADVIPTPPVEEVVDLVPDDVRAIGADDFLIEQVEDGVTVTLSITYDPPDPIGVFRGVAVHIVTPGHEPEHMGDFDYDGDSEGVGAARYGHAVITHAQPAEVTESWDVYLTSRSRAYRKPLDLVNSPKRTITISGDLLTASPDVQIFQAGTMDAAGVFTPSMRWDSAREKMLIDWGVLAPTTRANWHGVAVWIRTPQESGGYVFVQATGIMGVDAFMRDGDDLYYYDTIALSAEDIPESPETWRFIAVSYNRRGEQNLDIDGNPTGPYVDLSTLPNAVSVENFTAAISYEVSEAGDDVYRFYGSWTNPATPRYKGVRIVARLPGPVDVVLAIEQEGSISFRTDAWPIPSATTAVTIYAQTILGDNTLIPITAATPHVDLSIEAQTGPAGQEYAPLVTGASASVGYTYDEQGGQRFYFAGDWTNPVTQTKFRGVKVVARPAAGNDAILAIETQGAISFRTDEWPVPYTAENWTIYFVSIDANNRANTIVPGTTPSSALTVQRQVGGAGTEHAPVVTGATAVRTTPTKYADTTNFNSPGDVELWGLTLAWTNPVSSLYTGCKPYACLSGEGIHKNRPLADERYPSTGVITDQWPLSETITLDVWFVSCRGELENTIVDGVTPKATLTVTKATPGTVKGDKIVDLVIAAFAAGIRPVLLVAALPGLPNALYPAGLIAYHTGEGRLYRVNAAGTAWVYAINGGLDIVADSITAGQIAAGAIGTAELYAGEIKVGGGGGKPGKFGVYNASDVLIGFIGIDGTDEGAWFKTISIGGTSYATGKVKADASGNVTISGATLTLTSGTVTITIDGTDYIKVADSAPASHCKMTGGMVLVKFDANLCRTLIYPDILVLYDTAGNQVAQISNASAIGYLDLYNAGTLKIRLDATTGTINAVDHYKVNGTQVVGARQAAIANPTGSGTAGVDTPARVAIADILYALRTHGLIAT